MVVKAEDYPWSSAATHYSLSEAPMLATLPESMNGISQDHWSEWLSRPEQQDVADTIRRNVGKGLPYSNDNFINAFEGISKRALRYKPQGRPIKGD